MPTWGPHPPFMAHLPHGQDQEREQQQAAQHAYQHPPDWNLSLLQDTKQVRLNLRANARVFSVTLTPALLKDSNLCAEAPGASHLPVPLLGAGVSHPHPAGLLPPPHCHGSILTLSFPLGRLRAGTE